MKNIRKRVFALTATIAMIVTLLPVSIFAEESEIKDSNTNVLEKGPQTREITSTPVPDAACTITPDGVITAIDTAQLGGSVNISIPSTVNGITVTSIKGREVGYRYENVFGGDKTIETIVLPDTLTSIGKHAFRGSALISIDIPISVITLDYGAFSYCESLTSITIRNGLASIGEYVFDNCTSLTSIDIPDSVTSIGDQSFNQCENLKNVKLPKNLTSIEYGVFDECHNLENINIPDSVTSIGDAAFYECKKLKAIHIPAGLISVADQAFQYCENLEGDFDFPDTLTSIGVRAFFGCKKITSMKIPGGVTKLEDMVFDYCLSLTDVELSEGLKIIDSNAFSASENLTNINIPGSVTTIGRYAFSGCSKLTSIDIPDSVTSIGNGAFYSSGLTSIDIPDSVTSISEEVFNYCNNLTNVNIPDSLISIGDRAFNNCTQLEKVIIRSEKDDYDDHMNSLINTINSQSGQTVTKYLGNTKFEAKQAQMNSFGEQVYDLDDLITVPTVYKYNADGTKEKSNDFQFSPVAYKLEKQSRRGTTSLDTVNKKLYIAEDENSILTLSATYEGKTVSTAITASPVVLESIKVKTNPTQIEYRDGDVFKPDGLVITQIYNNGDQKDIVYDNEKNNFTFDLSLLQTGDKEVTVTYAGKQTKIDIEVLRIAILANPDLNVIEGMKESYTQGDNASFTARGDKPDNINPVKGDTRYVPASFKVTETTSFSNKYEGSFSAMELGNQVLSVTFHLEEYDGSQWILKGSDLKEKEFTVTEKIQIEVPEAPGKDPDIPTIEENKPIEDSLINTINPETDSKDIIETSDETSLMIYIGILMISGGVGYLLIKKRKEIK